jgi:hypothetical protein
MVWIITNQLGRRNITDFARAELALKRKEILLKQGREKQKQTLKQYNEPTVLPNLGKTDTPHNTQKKIAEEVDLVIVQ